MAKTLKIGNRLFPIGEHTYVMGILNVTPDSFSDGGNFNDIDRALFRAEQMIAEGADILDIGGESTRPNFVEVSQEQEIERTAPIIQAVKERFDIPVSIDTYKEKVAREAVRAGADMINDIMGLRHETKMAQFVSENKLPICIMHNRNSSLYEDFWKEIMEDLQESILIAEDAGISKECIILDPGIGFAKSYEQNLECIQYLERFSQFGVPVLLGTSRKSVIGNALNLPASKREEGTLATTVMAVMKGCDFVRVHNVEGNVRAIQMTETILKRR